ncbi:MAG: tRNA uridine-5-carboxymethylaminomethyl(34) synthesis GTPase MnmE [Clostridiales bacterium]|jgi:tRNA modification GTPase|nr:tRNA uridine-5-carboxymethylaminomethyl(34) synthesis GTPase MnmE [Clostridiales bacterium]
MSETIAAFATPLQQCAIGIIRLSGDDAFFIFEHVFRPNNGRSPSEMPSRQILYGSLLSQSGETLDHCLAFKCEAPHSYTGENTVEFHCHGSPAVMTAALRTILSHGARQADAGEFTKRAFLNGKLDLIQAEAVIDLIQAETEAMMKNAASQLSGTVSKTINRIYDSLLDILAHFHAIIDYPDEDLEPFEASGAEKILSEAKEELTRLSKSYARGRIIKNGIKSAIVGKPNAGKSSLLNALLGYERAIVTPIAGTTRDTIEEKILLGGVLLRLTDTAGIRETQDEIEKLGVLRSIEAAKDAELVLSVFDGSEPLTRDDQYAITAAKNARHSIAVINKSDLVSKIDIAEIERAFETICRVSALDKTGLDKLDSIVSKMFGLASPVFTGEIITNERQADAVSRALNSVETALFALGGFTPDAVLIDVEEALSAIGELSGRTVRDDIISRIFERFCVGK